MPSSTAELSADAAAVADAIDLPSQYRELTQGNLIDRKTKLRAEIAALNKQVDFLEQHEKAIDQALMAKLDEEGTTKASGRTGTVSISESVVPTVRDWESFYDYIKANNYFHLLERRPSATGCRELFERAGAIPGVEPFTKRSLRYHAL
jgi:hypothetical protein